LKGVAADIVLPDVLDHSPFVGEVSLDYPLPWDTIDPVDFTRLNRVQPYLAELKARSNSRLATNQDFLYIKQDIGEYEKMHEDRTATINEAEAIRQREQAIAEVKVRTDERESRPAPQTLVYDLTVENSGDSGLPAPMSFYSTNPVTTAYRGIPPVIYYRDGTNLIALPGKSAKLSVPAAPIKYTVDKGAKAFFDKVARVSASSPAKTVPGDSTSAQVTSVVATWSNASDLQLPADFSKLPGISRVGNTLSVTNPVELDRNAPDATLEETEQILQDYISLMGRNSPLIVSH